MIITPDDKIPQDLPKSKIQQEGHPAPDMDEPPPSYSASSDTLSSGPSTSTTFKTKPTNYLTLSNEHNAIRGEFVIDPSIRIPESVLPPLEPGETEADRKNLSLKSQSGSVQAEIWLLAPGETMKSKRTTMALASKHGNINAQVHTLDGAPPIALTADATHGNIRLALPRTFQGLLSLSTHHGNVTLSDALVQHTTQLSQVGDTRRYFVGDFSLFGDTWEGDQAELTSVHGNIKVRYVEEVEDAKGKKGLFGRLFGR